MKITLKDVVLFIPALLVLLTLVIYTVLKYRSKAPRMLKDFWDGV